MKGVFQDCFYFTALSLPEPINQDVKMKEENSEDSESKNSGDSLFTLLPQPTNKKPDVVEDDDEFLHKKETNVAVKPKAKITVPCLSDVRILTLSKN